MRHIHLLVTVLLVLSLHAREKKRFTRPKKNSQNLILTTSPHGGKQMGVVQTPGVPPVGHSVKNGIKIFHLTAQPVEQMLTDGTHDHQKLLFAMKNILGLKHKIPEKKLTAWGYNGSTPGPTIELIVGDRVRIVLKNELPEPTLLHIPGLEHPHELDRSSDRKPIHPGQIHTYEFTVHQPGTFLYHSGCSIAKHNRRGLVGMIIVHPKQYEEPVDKHISLIIQEWALAKKSSIPNNATDQFNWFTLNGHSAPSIPIIKVDQDERVRLHIGSLALHNYSLHLHGYTWSLVGTEGGLIEKSAQIKGAVLQVPPGTTRTVEFDAWNPGMWPFYSLTRHESHEHSTEVPLEVTPHGGIFTLLDIEKKDPAALWSYPENRGS